MTQPVWIAGEAHTTREVVRIDAPFDGAPIDTHCLADAACVEKALSAAQAAFVETRAMPTHRRRDFLITLAARVEADADEAATLLAREAAKPITLARVELARAVATFRLAAEACSLPSGECLALDLAPSAEGSLGITRQVAAGPVLAIAPFNFPLNLVVHKLAPAFALGAPVVLKPAPQTPLSALRLAQHVYAAAHVHSVNMGILSVLPCTNELAQRMVEDPRFAVLSFTGSDAVGWRLKALAGKKRVLLELGGNAAAIVTASADLGACVPRVVSGAFGYAGQVCIKVQRLLVARAHYDAALAEVVTRARALRVGDPLAHDTVLSVLIDARSKARIAAWLDEAAAAGATVHCGGQFDRLGLAPTVLTGAGPGMKLYDGEVFGPVLTVEPFDTLDEAIARVNAGRYGLQAGVFTRDLGEVFQAFSGLDVGGLMVNEVPTFRVDAMPYGGVKDSGLGREGVRYAMAEMSETRLLVVRGITM
ncbi:MAG: aldehyde dehydrogenase family protein [Myxococcales bacterium]|nr:aldehyde dehydrogenase family protein [Myxococcales bacterium]